MKYILVKPSFGDDTFIQDLVFHLLEQLGIADIHIMDYDEAKNLSQHENERIVLFHVCRDMNFLEKETDSIDVFVNCAYSGEAVPEGYFMVEQASFGSFNTAIFTHEY